eukprot:7315658-Alexandrium_andersonii.AAC.1
MFSRLGPGLSERPQIPWTARPAMPERSRGRAREGGPFTNFSASALQHARPGRSCLLYTSPSPRD